MKNHFLELLATKSIPDEAKTLIANQIELFFNIKKVNIKHQYNIGDAVFLPQGTLIHGTYKNLKGLKEISQTGLITSDFVLGHKSKYPFTVSVWRLNKDYYLKDYINFYSGGTIRFRNPEYYQSETLVVPYDKMSNITNIINAHNSLIWQMEQTKEARFLPSLVQDFVQIGIIFNSNNSFIQSFLNADVLQPELVTDNIAQYFVHDSYKNIFLQERKKKDDFFTDRESAIIFGIPACFIEGVLVGKEYEYNPKIIQEIKNLVPNCYICNLDGCVICN